MPFENERLRIVPVTAIGADYPMAERTKESREFRCLHIGYVDRLPRINTRFVYVPSVPYRAEKKERD
jgi:hypothetical protein